MTLCEAVASRDVVHVVALPTPPRLLSTALTMMLLRMSARKASYQALRMTSSRNVSAAPAGKVGGWECYLGMMLVFTHDQQTKRQSSMPL